MQHMKKIFHLILMILSIILFGNQRLLAQNYNDDLKASLLQKSRNQKTGAWILLGGGAALLLGGAALAVIESPEDTEELLTTGSTTSSGSILMVAGILSMAGSIPLFIASGNNHQKALRLSVGTQQIKLPFKGAWTCQYQPAVSLKFSLGRR